jgi:cytoskeletal protein CcmA (bactofilin family)
MSDLSSQHSNLIIGEGVTFVGSISAPGRASIHGMVTGEISVADLQIGPKGSVTGNISAQVIDVHGVLAENIVCHDHILIHRTGSVSGNLDYSEIEIERGGQFKGQMTQHPSGQVQAKPLASSPNPGSSKPFKPGN